MKWWFKIEKNRGRKFPSGITSWGSIRMEMIIVMKEESGFRGEGMEKMLPVAVIVFFFFFFFFIIMFVRISWWVVKIHTIFYLDIWSTVDVTGLEILEPLMPFELLSLPNVRCFPPFLLIPVFQVASQNYDGEDDGGNHRNGVKKMMTGVLSSHQESNF